jgi:hypothetical protein
MLKFVGAAGAAVALSAAPVQAACWTGPEATAATLRELQSMLMVATLRCQVARHDITAEYNDYLRANKVIITRGNDRLKAHFVKANGAGGSQRAYDSFTTHLANGYGADGSSGELCDNVAGLSREAALLGGNEEAILLLAERQGLIPDLPGGLCTAPAAAKPRVATAGAGAATYARER